MRRGRQHRVSSEKEAGLWDLIHTAHEVEFEIPGSEELRTEREWEEDFQLVIYVPLPHKTE